MEERIIASQRCPYPNSPKLMNMLCDMQEGIKIVDGNEFANSLILRQGNYHV